MAKKVTFIEINVYEGMLPLVSGYLEAYACEDPEIKAAFEFDRFTCSTTLPLEDILRALFEYRDSDLFAFSCYLWNMKLMKKIIPAMMEIAPNATFLLGGPQVMHHAEEYLFPENENVIICNGEGERTFRNFLKEMLEAKPDYSNVRGLSLYKNRALITTEAEERIKDLNEIPSPFLSGVLDEEIEKGNFRMTVLETNRGCPFRCGFCFWGAATNDRVYKFEEERVRKELAWISEKKVPFILIADANWGMLKRDVEFSRYIAEQKVETGLPVYVYFSSAKNSPARVSEITRLFAEVDLISVQSISMQTLDETTLDYIDRKNIRLTAFEKLQEDLNERKINSFIELIWPLPGETLTSYKNGLETLFERRASVIITYGHLLLHNTPLYKKQKELGLVLQKIEDDASESDVVVATAEVPYDDFQQGWWFYYAIISMYNTRTIYLLSHYLHDSGQMTFQELYTAFCDYCQREAPEHVYSQYCLKSISNAEFIDIVNYPWLYHTVLHTERVAFETLLCQFVAQQSWWQDDKARALFEIDLICRPFVYSNTPMEKDHLTFNEIEVIGMVDRSYFVNIPEQYLPLLKEYEIESMSDGLYKLDHSREQFAFRHDHTRQQVGDYCHGKVMSVMKILPLWIKPELEGVLG